MSGVFKDFPDNSTITIDFIVPFTFLGEVGFETDTWTSFSWQTFMLLDNSADVSSFEEKIAPLINEFIDTEEYILKVQALADLHFYKTDGSAGRIIYIRVFFIIGIVIVLLACINFTNISTARATKRFKEIGIRKAVGAIKTQLILQFLIESFLMVFISMIIAMSIVELFRPSFNELAGKAISISYINLEFIGIVVLLSILTALLSGIYPAFILSSFNPISALKGVKNSENSHTSIRKILVIVQFKKKMGKDAYLATEYAKYAYQSALTEQMLW